PETADVDEGAAPPGGPRIVGDRYRLGPLIGRGGMATIHRATDIRVEREVAVKLLRPEVGRDVELAQRFRREALAATVLRHPNIVACLDAGTDGDQPFLVMELVDGEDLAARLKRGGRLAPEQVSRIGLDIARGLGVAHVRGIVHRDVKPGNILLAADGRAMITDFGIARLAADAEASRPGTTLGSVHYFSPEQARGLTTTPASDVYGLGLVLYESLTGTRAWAGDTAEAIALARVGAAPPSARVAIPQIPAALDAVVLRAMAPEPGDRFPSGAAMAAALEPIVAAVDPSVPTERYELPGAVASTVAAMRGGVHPPDDARPATVPPLVPGAPATGGAPVAPPDAARGAPSAKARRPIRRGLAALGIGAVLLGALLMAALPGSGLIPASDGPQAAIGTATPRPTARATPSPTPDPTPAPTPRPSPTAAPTVVPAGRTEDLCEPFLGLPCGLDAGRYAPSRFEPAFDIRLGDGWATAFHDRELVALSRDEGLMTFASGVTTVDPDGRAANPRDRARALIEAIVVTDGVAASRPAAVRIDGRRGLSIDLAPVDARRIALFSTAAETYYLEPARTTRLVAIDVRGRAVLLAIEPSDRSDLRSILDTADAAAGTIRWR
ncbi:MAG: protein kinase, partial [Chloroflexota bacterium]|nr:protein kinase [Chloroflexota bacterium]